MPKRVPLNTIILKRDGKNRVPTIGVPFDFTQAEIDDINRIMPKAIRKIVVEDEPVMNEEPQVDSSKKSTSGEAQVKVEPVVNEKPQADSSKKSTSGKAQVKVETVADKPKSDGQLPGEGDL